MTRINQPSAQTATEAHAAGWIASFVLHGTLALGAFIFLQQITLAPQTTPFTWNVAMVTPTKLTSPAPTTARQSARAAEPPPRPLPAKTEAASQPMEPLPPTVDRHTPMRPTPRLFEEYTLSRPVEPAPPLKATEPAAQDSRAVDPAPYPLTPTAPPQPASSPSIESAPSAHDAPVIGPKDSSSLQQTTTSPDPHVAALSQAKSDKTDYGWLADLMAKWIGELDKRYPTILRTEGVTGRVTLTALLHQDGNLSDVRVVKSSGNTLLDQVAVEDITNGPPVKLSRPLQRPSMPVKFSIVYDLKTAR